MENKFIELHVYDAMVDFLYDYARRRYGYGTLQEILLELSPLPEGGTSNPAMRAEWEKCINKSLKEPLDAKYFGKVAKRKYTKIQSFNAMVDFLTYYYQRTLSGDLNKLSDVICSFPENPTDLVAWDNWNNVAERALQKQTIKKFVDETVERKLTKLQAFNVMVKFLEEYYKKTASDLGGVLSSLFFLPDGDTADPAFWEDWGVAIKKILNEQNNQKCIEDEILGKSITESQAFDVMVQFFRNYYESDPDDPDAIMFFNYLHLLSDSNSSPSSAIKEQWKQCVDSALKEKPGIRKYRILCRG